jgi:hypothetical protein
MIFWFGVVVGIAFLVILFVVAGLSGWLDEPDKVRVHVVQHLPSGDVEFDAEVTTRAEEGSE